MASTSRPEPMNASPHHPKVKVTCQLSDPLYVAGGFIAGKMEVECRTDKGLGLGVIMVELSAIEGQLYSRPSHLCSVTLIFHLSNFVNLVCLPVAMWLVRANLEGSLRDLNILSHSKAVSGSGTSTIKFGSCTSPSRGPPTLHRLPLCQKGNDDIPVSVSSSPVISFLDQFRFRPRRDQI